MFDNDRKALLPVYAPNATFSVSVNTLMSRSYLASKVHRGGNSDPRFQPWYNIGLRNLFRGNNSVSERTKTLKSPMRADDLLTMWKDMPITRHPLTDASKWNFDTWILDGAGADTKVCAVLQGEFEERQCSSLQYGDPLLTARQVPPVSSGHSLALSS